MAQKKFSRLSIMLEAKDRMSRPMMNAARASSLLRGRVNQLSETLNRSRSSVVNASTSQRILAERYRDLGRRIGVADEKLKLSVKLFRSLPAPIRLATYMVEGYAKAIWHMATQNTVARIATKLLTVTFKGLRAAASNISWDIERAAKAVGNFTWRALTQNRVAKALSAGFKTLGNNIKLATKYFFGFTYVGKGLSLIGHTFKNITDAVKQMNFNIFKGIKASFIYQLLSHSIKTVVKDLKWAAIAQKTFIKDLPYILKQSQAYKGLQKNLQAAYLAFNLWKNASPTVEKITNKVKALKNGFMSLFAPISKNIENLRKLGQTASQTGGRGRATFNQLADANARLNREITRMNAELAKANSRLGKMRSSLGSINAMGAAFTAMYTGQAMAHTGGRVVESTVGKAMEQNYSSASVGILAGAENGAKFYRQIQEYAASTAYSAEDWARNMRGAISKSKSVKDLEQYQIVLEQLATLDPIQGLDGAALAVRELNSGDIVSLVERFELPRGLLKEIKGIEDPIKQIQALSKIIGEQTGYTVKNVQEMKKLPLMQWQKMTNSIKTAMGWIGSGALERLAPLFKKFNEMWDAGKFEPFIKMLTDKFTAFTEKAIEFVSNFGKNTDGLKQRFQPYLDLFNNIKNSIVQAWPTISEILGNVNTVFMDIAGTINDKWPTVNTILQEAVGFVKDFTSWISDNWETVKGSIIVTAGAFAAFKIVSGITTLITLYRNGMLLATAANWLMNTSLWAMAAALWANPIALIVAAIVALGIGLYIAYQKNETFRKGVQKALGWLKDVGVGALNLGKKAIDGIAKGFKSAWEWIKKAYDKLKPFIELVKKANPVSGAIELGKWAYGKLKADGSHHGGLNNVPYDGYTAQLHKGERVLTAQENKEYGKGGQGVLVSGNTFIVRQDSDIDAIAEALYEKLSGQKLAMG